MFDGIVAIAGGANRWAHRYVPNPIDEQNVIRMNLDTLYSAAIVDISQGATLTMPDAGDRYMTAMIANEDHYVNRVFSGAGIYDLTVDEFDTPFVMIDMRTLVDPTDTEDVAEVNRLQDALVIESVASRPYTHPEYDEDSRKDTYEAIYALAQNIGSSARTFGKREEVGAIRHMIATASGWGGRPSTFRKQAHSQTVGSRSP